ncbi:MAG: preprotein translocase subunit SecA, partial [Acaryochloridaceae cyanobacterium RU_4_10]|nr:preprotein translocase subunit SecA [Acaryochloridaceae cyanobacterium RU_4_10]
MLKTLLGDPNKRKLKKYQPDVVEINLLEEELKGLSDLDLQGKTKEFQQRIEKGESLDDLLPEAFAVVREASRRVLGLRHFDVQMLGGMILHDGQIAEMRTGEGKTLVATLPSYLNALSGKGVHVITVNDYLARRDAEWMGQIHRFLGLSVGLIQQNMTPMERQKNYACDITYGTNSEIGFDYLRDNMATSMEEVVQRPFNYCVIDEVDSVLIDEARTPLIISGQVERPTEKYLDAARIALSLKPEEHYEVDEKARNVVLNDEGFIFAEQLLKVDDLFDPQEPWAHYIFNAIKAKELFIKDVNYIVKDGEIVIVDEFTGRVMTGRRWSDGLHQAIEAKEDLEIEKETKTLGNIEIQNETQTLASITYQNLFLLYPKLSGMTGTAKTEEAEFGKIYKLEVTTIPTNRINRRQDLPDVVYKTENAKWLAVAQECIQMNEMGRPVLVGTTSVEKSEVLSRLLLQQNIPHNLLNAKPENVERESEIVAQAGRKGAVTISTNMAGRGTDIILGGNADYMARLKVREYFMPRIVLPQTGDPMGVIEFGMPQAPAAIGFGGDAPAQSGIMRKTWKASPTIFPTQISKDTESQLKSAVSFAVKHYGEQSMPELQAEELLAIAAEK